LNFCRALEAAGASALCVHGRTRDQKGFKTGAARWEPIAAVVQALRIPVIANGGVESRADADACLLATGAAAVMSAEALLEDPGLFNAAPPASMLGPASPLQWSPRARLPPVFGGGGGVVASFYDHDYRFSGSGGLDGGAALAATVHRVAMTPTAYCAAYLAQCKVHPPPDFFKCVKAHALKLLHRPLALAAAAAAAAAVSMTTAAASGEAAAVVAGAGLAASGAGYSGRVDAGGAAARAAVVEARDEAELLAGVVLLDAFMGSRAAALRAAAQTDDYDDDGRDAARISTTSSTSRWATEDSPEEPGAARLPPSGESGVRGGAGVGAGRNGPFACAACDEAPGGACDCWREDTWYRRHRRGTGALGGLGGGEGTYTREHNQSHAVQRRSRKDQRREKYIAMGYNGL
jgi:hypothetical protein